MSMLQRSRIGLLVAFVGGLGLPAKAADIDKLLPDQTELVVVINVNRIVEAPLFKKHFVEELRGLLKGSDDASKILQSIGFDPLKDLSNITLAGSGVSQDAKFLAVVHGKFDPAKLEAKAEEVAKEKGDTLKILKEGGQKIYEFKPNPNEDKPQYAAIIDKDTLVGSNDKDYVLDALAKAAGKKKSTLKKEIQALIEKADADQSLWLAIPGSTLGNSEVAGDQKAKQSIEKIQSITAGITIGKDVKLGLTVAAKSADNAKELAEEIKEGLTQAKGFLAILAGNEKKLAPVVDLVGSIKVATEGSAVTLKSEVSEELIEKGLKKDQ
jgi:hypothetical protein